MSLPIVTRTSRARYDSSRLLARSQAMSRRSSAQASRSPPDLGDLLAGTGVADRGVRLPGGDLLGQTERGEPAVRGQPCADVRPQVPLVGRGGDPAAVEVVEPLLAVPVADDLRVHLITGAAVGRAPYVW
ncbi:hypothetical protein AB0N16_21715 [Streptomyces sp. NPDC051105]|uniref:hypothetical protein n=1 Tax=Streptomyces sp. NPDC051105 TaxID=3154843 RepID=UPI003414A5D1